MEDADTGMSVEPPIFLGTYGGGQEWRHFIEGHPARRQGAGVPCLRDFESPLGGQNVGGLESVTEPLKMNGGIQSNDSESLFRYFNL